jgi:Kef-type K+ transport system membrane component KefB
MASFLPQYPFVTNPLLLFGLLLLAGYAGGELMQRVLGVPRIVGYALIGLVLGASGAEVLDARRVNEAWIVVDIALGLILFELGRRLDLAWLKRDRWLAATGVLESALAFVFVYIALVVFGVEPLVAAMAASIGMATSPAVVMVVAQELRAEGQVTERALNLVAMNSVIAFVTATMLLSWIHHEYRAGMIMVLLHPVYLLAGSLLLGCGAALAALLLGRWLGKNERSQYVLALGLVVVVVGAARMLEVPAVLAVLAFGVLSKNLDARHDLMPFDVGRLGQLFVVVLFVVTSATLKVGELVSGGALAAAFVLARFAGKSLGVLVLTYLSGVRRGVAGLLCLVLTPMSALAIAMVRGAGELYPEFGARLAAIVLPAVLILELVGPVAVQFALRRAGEAAREETAR